MIYLYGTIVYVIGFYTAGYVFIKIKTDQYLDSEERMQCFLVSFFWPISLVVILLFGVVYFLSHILSPYYVYNWIREHELNRTPKFIRNWVASIENKMKA